MDSTKTITNSGVSVDMFSDAEISASENAYQVTVETVEKEENVEITMEQASAVEENKKDSSSPISEQNNSAITENVQKDEVKDAEMDDDVKKDVEMNEESKEAIVRPVFNFAQTPVQLTGSWNEFKTKDNFFKGCKWAPDGSCILTNNNDGNLRLWNLPEIFYNTDSEANWSDIKEMSPVLKIREGELIYDYCWYPLMSSLDSATCCFASTCRNSPVHLLDAYTGELRCSYRPYNNVDEIEAAHSICFSPNGQKLYCGFNKVIRIFDVNIPGRNFMETKSKIQGQAGIISCIAVNPGMPDTYAAGSYLKSIALYSDGCLICLLQGQRGGVTHIEFSPDGNKLYSGGRMDPEILCWDLRNPGTVLYTMERNVTTNQRMYFCSDKSGEYILSGHNNGAISVWDTNVDNLDDVPLPPKLTFQGHDDCVNGIGLHPTLSLMATTSGQRKFPEPLHSDDSDSSSDETFTEKYISFDNSLRLWWVY
uniref:WD repeat-containing protein 79 n=1 Tax=Strigamia maritima TaxID=126957 RepID=T1J4T9_STRMM